MKLTLDTYHIPKRIKTGHCFDSTVEATVRFRKSGALASVKIADKVYNCFHEHFIFFQNMVNEALILIESDNKLDEDSLLAISAMRGIKL